MLKPLLPWHHITWHFIVHTETNSVSGCNNFQNGAFYEVAWHRTFRCVFHSSFFLCRSDLALPYGIFLFSYPLFFWKSSCWVSCWHL